MRKFGFGKLFNDCKISQSRTNLDPVKKIVEMFSNLI